MVFCLENTNKPFAGVTKYKLMSVEIGDWREQERDKTYVGEALFR